MNKLIFVIIFISIFYKSNSNKQKIYDIYSNISLRYKNTNVLPKVIHKIIITEDAISCIINYNVFGKQNSIPVNLM